MFATSFSELTGCVFIITNSSSVSLPGLQRMAVGMAILPMSCKSPAVSINSSFVEGILSSRARMIEYKVTRME